MNNVVNKELSERQDYKFMREWNLIGIVVLCLLSIPFHFLYGWLGENRIVGLFFPINESIWEHLKLVFFPITIWWLLGYLLFHRKENISFDKTLISATASSVLAMVIITSWYYVWESGIGISSAILHIGSIFIAVPIAQLVGIHVYRIIDAKPIYKVVAILFIIVFTVAFITFTLSPPDIPIFIEP